MSVPTAIAGAYDRWADSYDRDRNLTRDLDARVLQASGLDVRARRVVEIGCGTGKNTRWLASGARSLCALDFSEGMLARARAAVPDPHVRFVHHDLREAWPVPDESADIVVGNLVLEHVESLPPLFAEAARVMGSGGMLYLCELHPYRQLRGGQAHFTDDASGEAVHVPAFAHTVSEYVNAGIAAGLALRELGEWLEDGAPPGTPPRLLSMRFGR